MNIKYHNHFSRITNNTFIDRLEASIMYNIHVHVPEVDVDISRLLFSFFFSQDVFGSPEQSKLHFEFIFI